jgi:hypothetical protein
MSVEIDPVELGFARPFTTEVSQILKIRNPNVTPVAFKVKTTAPKQYCVRPNSGRIEPGKEVEVTVLLQAMKQDPPLEAKCRDKFLVQSVAVTADKEFTNIGSIWQHIDDTEREAIQEKKIRVVFLPPGATPSAPAVTPARAVNGTPRNNGTPDTSAPPAYSNRSPSPEQTVHTPQTRNTSTSIRTPSVGPSIKSEIKSEDESNGTPTPNPGTSSIKESISSAASAVSTAVPTTVEELKAQLAEAQAKIAAFSQEGGLRMRKVAQGETSNATVNEVATKLQGAEGVPVQIVAALCLLSFLLAYMFF